MPTYDWTRKLLKAWRLKRTRRKQRFSTDSLVPQLSIKRLEERLVLNADAAPVEVLVVNAGDAGGDGQADIYQVQQEADYIQVSVNGQELHRAPVGSLSAIHINGSADNDVLVADLLAGVDLVFDGGGGEDTLSIHGGEYDQVAYEFGDGSAGQIEAQSADGIAKIDFQGVEKIADSLAAADREFSFQGADRHLTLGNPANAQDSSRITISAGSTNADHSISVDFLSPTESLTVDTSQGDAENSDQVEVTGLAYGFDADFHVTGSANDHFLSNGNIDLGSRDFTVSTGSIVLNGGISSNNAEVELNAHTAIEINEEATIENDGGQVRLAAPEITMSGTISAAAGFVELDSGENGITLVEGVIDVSDPSEGGQGGVIHLLGGSVGAMEGAQLSAAGNSGGGTILIGGGYQGSEPAVRNANYTYVGATALLNADALVQGSGGRIIVWANEATRYFGHASARGGELGGDGGFVEVSGKQGLVYQGTVDLRAAAGDWGTLLLDPVSIQIADVPLDPLNNVNTDTPFAPILAQALSILSIGSIGVVGTLLNALSTTDTVIVQTGNLNLLGDLGNLSLIDDIDINGIGLNKTLILRAHNNILFNGSISDSNTATADSLNIVLIANSDNVGGGNIVIDAAITIADGDVSLKADNIAINQAINLGTADLMLDAAGNATQAAAGTIIAGGLALQGTGNFTLNNPANNVTTIAAFTGGTISYTDADGLEINEVTVFDNLDNEATLSGITTSDDDVRLVVGGDLSINAAINLDNTLINPPVAGNLLLEVAGNVTQTAAIRATGLALLVDGNTTLNTPTNNVVRIAAATGGTISYTDADGLEVGAVGAIPGIITSDVIAGASGSVTLTSIAGAITLVEDIVTGQSTVADAAGADAASSGNIVLSAATGITGAGVLRTGNVEVDAATAGDIDTATSGSITLSVTNGDVGLGGADALTIGSATVVNNTADDTATTGNITITANRVNDGPVVTVDNALDVSFGLASDGAINTAGVLSVTTDGGAGALGEIRITSGESLTLGEFDTDDATAQNVVVTVGAGAALTVGVANDPTTDSDLDTDNVTLTTDEIDVQDAGVGITLRAGVITVQTTTDGRQIDLGSESAGLLSLTTDEINELAATTLIVGSTDPGASAGDITITDAITPANITNLVLLTGGSLAIDQAIDLQHGADPDGNLLLDAQVNATQAAAITGGGLVLRGTGNFMLNDINNTFTTIAARTEGTIDYTNAGNLIVGTVTVVSQPTETGIQTSDDDIRLVVSNAGVLNPGNLTINAAINLDDIVDPADAGDLLLDVAGNVTQAMSGTIIATGLALLVQGTTDLQSDNDVDFIAANTNGTIDYVDVDDLTVGSVAVLGQPAVIGIETSDDDISLRLTGDNAVLTVPDIIGVDEIRTTGGAITLTADGMAFDASVATEHAINAGGGLVTLQANRDEVAIQIGFGASDAAEQLGLSDLELAEVRTSGGLTIGNSASNGGITIVGVTDLAAPANLTGGVLQLLQDAGNIAFFGTLTSPIDTSIQSNDGDIVFDTAGALLAATRIATLNAGGSINGHADVFTNITAATIDLVALDGGIGVVEALEIFATTDLNADTEVGNDGDIRINSIGDLPVGLVSAGEGNVTLHSTGDIDSVSSDEIADIRGAIIDLTAVAGGIGNTAVLEVTATVALNANTIADSGNIQIDSIGDLPLGLVTAGAGPALPSLRNITLTSTAAILDSDAATDIVGNDLILLAVTGIGATGNENEIDTSITSLEATNTTSGGIFVREVDTLIIGATGVRTLGGIIAGNEGDITIIVVAGNFTTDGVVTTAVGPGEVVLTDVGGDVRLTTLVGNLTVNQVVTSGNESIFLNAGNDMLINAAITADKDPVTPDAGSVQSIDLMAGNHTLNIGQINIQANLTADNTITVSAGQNSISAIEIGAGNTLETSEGAINGQLLANDGTRFTALDLSKQEDSIPQISVITVSIGDDMLPRGHHFVEADFREFNGDDEPLGAFAPGAPSGRFDDDIYIDTPVQLSHVFTSNPDDTGIEALIPVRITQLAKNSIILSIANVSLLEFQQDVGTLGGNLGQMVDFDDNGEADRQIGIMTLVPVTVDPTTPGVPPLPALPSPAPLALLPTLPTSPAPLLTSINAVPFQQSSAGATSQGEERYYELRIFSFDEATNEFVESSKERIKLSDESFEAIAPFDPSKLPVLFKRLPGDRYRIYLIEDGTERLMIEFVIEQVGDEGHPVEVPETSDMQGRAPANLDGNNLEDQPADPSAAQPVLQPESSDGEDASFAERLGRASFVSSGGMLFGAAMLSKPAKQNRESQADRRMAAFRKKMRTKSREKVTTSSSDIF